MKRFYALAAVAEGEGGWTVTLDGRPVRTPAQAALLLPTRALAEAVAAEFAAQGGRVEPQTMPMTGLGNAALDRMDAAVAERLGAYAASDLLCYRATDPDELAQRQAAAWDPPLAWARRRYDVSFVVTSGVMPTAQPQTTVTRLREVVAALDRFALAGLHPLVTVTGSLVLGLAVLEGAIPAEAAFAAGELDALWQAEQWGEDQLAVHARAVRERDMAAGARFLALLR